MSHTNFGGKGKAWKGGKDLLLTYGNRKMTIPLFNLPAVSTCPGSTALCRKYCYARAAEDLFKAVKAKRVRALKASKSADFVEVMKAEIATVPLIPFFRIHESGDFYSQEYLDKWFEICRAFPEKTFLAFTKAFKLDYSNRPKNLSLYFSVFPDTKVADIPNVKGAKRAYTTIDFKAVVAMGYKQDVGKAVKCGGNCDSCLICFNNKKDVYFPVHGRGRSMHDKAKGQGA